MPRKIITGTQMKNLEEDAFRKGADSLILMEKAAEGICAQIKEMTDIRTARVLFLCGSGNNGADGLAAARLLLNEGGKPCVFLAGEAKTPESMTQHRYCEYLSVPETDSLQFLSSYDLLVDALLGIGLSGEPRGKYAEIIREINASGVPVLSVDIPSGMNADTGEVPGACVRAKATVTFHAVKLGCVISPESHLCGKIICHEIGLRHSGEGIDSYTEEDLPALLPEREANAHKGKCGRVLIYAGSPGMAGAAAMCGLASLKAGAGLTTFICPEKIMPVLQTLVPNAMCVPVEERFRNPPECDVFACGCGIGQTPEALSFLQTLLQGQNRAVLDADALNLLSSGEKIRIPPESILTPHMGEAARLLHCSVESCIHHPLDTAEELSRIYRSTVVLKSSFTVICDGRRLAINTVGSPSLAKGGSGDALCGIIASQWCEKSDAFEAARIACLRHGMAGKAGAERFGVRQLLTGEMLSMLV